METSTTPPEEQTYGRIKVLHKFNATVFLTERGLSVRDTRLTICDVMDQVLRGCEPQEIQAWFNFTAQELADIMQFITENRAMVDAEYREAEAQAAEERRYWEERNRERLAAIEAQRQTPEYQAFWADLQERRLQVLAVRRAKELAEEAAQ